MKTEHTMSFFSRLIAEVRPADLLQREHRLALGARIEHILAETKLSRLQFGNLVRSELSELRGWLSDARDLTTDTLMEICALFHISIGDLVTE